MADEKIGVQLYGGKPIFGRGKESPLEADILFCDRASECSYYQEGKCLNVRAMFAPPCKFGAVSHVKGYTSRAAKYYDFKRRYTEDPLYGKLLYPKRTAAVMRDYLFIATGLVNVRKRREDDEKCRKDINGYIISDPGFGNCCVFMPKEDATNELLKAIFSFVPNTMMGDNMKKEWKEKRVPEILQDIKFCAPDIYQRFTEEFPEYIFEPNYIGKTVYVDSLKPGTRFTQKNVTWLYDGEYVISEKEVALSFASPWWSQGGTKSVLKIKVNSEMTLKVESNEIIDDNVRFA